MTKIEQARALETQARILRREDEIEHITRAWDTALEFAQTVKAGNPETRQTVEELREYFFSSMIEPAGMFKNLEAYLKMRENDGPEACFYGRY